MTDYTPLMRKYSGRIAQYSTMSYEDALQELRIAKWQAKDSYIPITIRRKARRLIESNPDRDLPLYDVPDQRDFTDKIHTEIILDKLEDYLSSKRKIVFQHFRRGYTPAETARKLGVTRQRIHQIVEDIRQAAFQLKLTPVFK